jgi:DNA-binding transcriptional ArsR family regulator
MDENETAAAAHGDIARRRRASKRSPVTVKNERPRSIEPEARPEKYAMGKSSTVRVDRPPVSSESAYTAISFGHIIRSQRTAVVKTLAVVEKSSWVEPDGRRVTRSTDRHLAELASMDPETIARHLAELEKAGVITIEGEGRRLIVIHDQAVGVGDWRINLFDDHPAWAVSPRAFKVYLGFRKFAGKKTACNPTDRTLAEFLAMSVDSVQRGMAELRKCMGIVTTCSPFHRDRRSKSRTIHLAPPQRWIVMTPVDPPPDPKSASVNTSMGADFGFDDRPERVDPTRKSAPEQSEICTPTIRNLPPNNPKSAPIEVRIEDKNKLNPNPNPLRSERSGQSESEPERVVGVVDSVSVPPPDTEPKTDPADELIGRLAKAFDESDLKVSGKIEFKRVVREIYASHGPIAAAWVEDALRVRDSPEIRDLGNLAIAKLRRWTKLTAAERAEVPDETKAECTARMDRERKARIERGSRKETDVQGSRKETDALAEYIKRKNEDTLQHYESGIEKTERRLGLYGMGDITCESEKFERTRDAIKGVSLDMDPEKYEAALKAIFTESLPFGEELKKREKAANQVEVAPTPPPTRKPPGPPPGPPATIPAMASR